MNESCRQEEITFLPGHTAATAITAWNRCGVTAEALQYNRPRKRIHRRSWGKKMA